jgi:transposase
VRFIDYAGDVKRDGRTLDHRTLEENRRMAVERVREGEDASAVMASYGFSRTTIYKWLRASSGRGKGLRALASRKASGRPRTLTAAQERQVFRWINGKDPRQYGFDFALWTRKVVGALIEREFGVQLGVTAVGMLLAKLGLTPQKPLQRAYQRDPEAIARWQQEIYPRLAQDAKARGAQIYFWDESGFRADAVRGKTWGVQGQTPVVAVPGQRQSMSAASAINARGAFWFVTYHGALNAERFVDYLKRLMKHRKNPLTLILDSLPAHKGPLVRNYVDSLQGKLQLHYLPGYAPELNPDELVWNHMKRTGTAKKPLRKGDQLQSRIDADLQAIQRDPRLVRSFFRAPSVAYISDC